MSSKNKPNGHSALLAESSGANPGTISLSGMGQAASVDASELSVVNASASSAAARADRDAYADVAQAQGEGKQSPAARTASRSHQDGSTETGKPKRSRKLRPGLEPLPIDGEAFVDAVHSRVDLVLLEVKLLKSDDEKVAQRELAYLRELRYGKRAPAADDEPIPIIFDAPRPERELP